MGGTVKTWQNQAKSMLQYKKISIPLFIHRPAFPTTVVCHAASAVPLPIRSNLIPVNILLLLEYAGDLKRNRRWRLPKNPIKTTFRTTINCSSQEGDAKKLWVSKWRFLGRASRVTAKAQKTFRGKFPKNSILSTFRVFALSRSDVLLTLRYIH